MFYTEMIMNESLITDSLPKLKFAEAEKLCASARHAHKAIIVYY